MSNFYENDNNINILNTISDITQIILVEHKNQLLENERCFF